MIQNETMRSILARRSYELYAAAFFGYPGPSVKDRGERKGAVEFK